MEEKIRKLAAYEPAIKEIFTFVDKTGGSYIEALEDIVIHFKQENMHLKELYQPRKAKSKSKPSGFIAICQCGKTVGAMDYKRTDTKDAGAILGKWIADGCNIISKFGGTWSATIENCECKKS